MNHAALEADLSRPASRVLVVDDEAAICRLYATKLNLAGTPATSCESMDEALELIAKHKYEAVLLDLFMGEENTLNYLGDIFNLSPLTKVVILTGSGSIDYAVNAMNKGASGFLVKTDDPSINIEKLKSIAFDYPEVKSNTKTLNELGIIGHSQEIAALASVLKKLQSVDSTVLLQGESGTGKELVARAIHKLSPRANGQFIAINCAAISENILESELFGYKRGAFTDAKKDRKGYFETCSNGTLFLDEIGEMSPGLQSKLLRVIQEKEVTPLGSCTPVPINTRIVAATNRNLRQEVLDRKFREDLFYRLAVFQIDLPSLRDRKEDIPMLVEHFISYYNQRFGKNIAPPAKGLYLRLKAYDWPGNVRELQNAVERAVVLSTNGEFSEENLLPYCSKARHVDPVETTPKLSELPLDFKKAKESFEKFYIQNLLEVTEGNVTEAARVSGQYRPNVYRLINKFHIDPQQFK